MPEFETRSLSDQVSPWRFLRWFRAKNRAEWDQKWESTMSGSGWSESA